MFARILLAVSVGALLLTGCATDGDTTATSTSARDDERIQATEALFADYDGTTPGCVVGVADEGDVVYEDAYGLADTDTGELLTTEYLFDIGSVSKQITAGAIMQLVDEGEIDLDDDIRDYLPDLPEYESTVTVADLVHHTSGLPDYVDELDFDLDEVTTADDALEVLEDEDATPAFEPGSAFEYSNTNYFLLGQIVEAVTDETLVDYATEEIFAPLGMEATSYRDDQGELFEGQAAGHVEEDGDFEVVSSAWRQTGDGAVHTTAADLLTWAEVFVDPDVAADLGGDGWLDLMLEPGPVADEDGVAYAGGIEERTTPDGELLFHGGSWYGYSSALAVDPAAGLVATVLCNLDDVDAEELTLDVLDVWRD